MLTSRDSEKLAIVQKELKALKRGYSSKIIIVLGGYLFSDLEAKRNK